MTRAVTEDDLRMPEFRGANLDDYEVRGDGKVVRKDRWIAALRAIGDSLGMDLTECEIADVVQAVERNVRSLPSADQLYRESVEVRYESKTWRVTGLRTTHRSQFHCEVALELHQ